MDYFLADQVITFDGTQNQLCVNLMTIDDSVYEFDETLFLELTLDNPSVSLTPSMANVTILDNDPGNQCKVYIAELYYYTLFPVVNLAIVNSTMMVFEGDGAAELCISIDTDIERPVTVSINAMSGTALGMT